MAQIDIRLTPEPGDTVYLKGYGKAPFLVTSVGPYAAAVRGRDEAGRTVLRAVDYAELRRRPAKRR